MKRMPVGDGLEFRSSGPYQEGVCEILWKIHGST